MHARDPHQAWDLICISHLWWDWVWQRPQQLITRLARHQRVLWIEEPRIAVGPPGESFELTEEWPNVWVGRLVYRSDPATFHERLEARIAEFGTAGFDPSSGAQHASLLFQGEPLHELQRAVLKHVPEWRRASRLVLWMYAPTGSSFVDLLQPDLVVYDVMDDLSGFRFPQPGLLEHQDALLARADLVFAGGPSIRDGVLARRPDTYLFPSGVDQQHFARARDPNVVVPPGVANLPRPIVGFVGVIDERTDMGLLQAVATQRPGWSWVLIGPVTKIAPETLPRLPNIHYLGMQDYRDLPAYIKSFDVAMMPFALNEATRSISPTKTLEYLAAGKPVVSTAIRDVVSLYGSVVHIADGPAAFVAAVEAALAEENTGLGRREDREQLVANSSWDAIADAMHRLVVKQLQKVSP
jgi:glycosyltransferase involved in cell wall biosynthesis